MWMRILASASVLLLSIGCSHATRVRPTPRNAYEVEAAIGGPLVKVGPIIPAPLTSVGVRYGVHNRGDIAAHLHLTTAVFGVSGGDLDTTWRLLDEQGAIPQISLNGRLYAFNKEGVSREYLELTPSASWLLGERWLTYVSGTALAQFHGGPLLFSAAVGEEVKLGRFSLQGELRWYQPDLPTRFVVVDWMPVFGQGGWGVILAGSYRFGGGAK